MHVFCLCAQWCGTCREYQPIFAQLASQWQEVKFVWVDIESHDDLLGDLDIENFPTLLIADAQGRVRFAGTVLPHAETLQRTPLAELWRHPLHTREVGSQLTNVLRCLYLEAHGYQVTVTELVGWEHSMKNELILAKFTGHRKQASADRLNALLKEFGLEEMGTWWKLGSDTN